MHADQAIVGEAQQLTDGRLPRWVVMQTLSDHNEPRAVLRGLWRLLRLSLTVRLDSPVGELLLSFPIKSSKVESAHSEQPPHQSSPPGQQHLSAAAADPAVKELRKRLGCQQSLLTEWEAAGERVSDQLLWRWVRAKGSLLAAESCISQHALWRIQLGTITEDDIRRELSAEKVFQQGCDVLGRKQMYVEAICMIRLFRSHHDMVVSPEVSAAENNLMTMHRPVVIVLAARHIIRGRNLEETEKLITFTLENALRAADLAKNPMGQILCIFDLSGLGLGNLDTKALQAVFAVLQQHFPESLSELWFLNAPFIFWGLWRVVSPFIQPATRKKIRFVSGAERDELLRQTIPKQALPRCYGGAAELVGVDVAARLTASDEARRLAVKVTPKADADRRGPSRVAMMRRRTVRSLGSAWAFAREHNPVWAARIFGRGVRRAALSVPRPGKASKVNRHASLFAERMQVAWQNRPALPRPSFRYRPRVEDAAHVAFVNVASFYLILVFALALAFVLYQQWMLSAQISAVF